MAENSKSDRSLSRKRHRVSAIERLASVVTAPWWARGLFRLGLRFFAGILSLVTGRVRASWPYREGLARARGNAEVATTLGDPIEAALLFNGSFKTAGDEGFARMAVPIRGSKSAGMMILVADKQAGRWSFQRAEVLLDGGRRVIDLLTAIPDAPFVDVLPPTEET
jgi:hypothetical protein